MSLMGCAMNLNWDRERSNVEVFIRELPEQERMTIVRQYCYEQKILLLDPSAKIENKSIFPQIGSVLRKMGYRYRYVL